LTSLKLLECSNNLLSALPDSIGLCANLETLCADNNNIWSIPDTLSECSNLAKLSVKNNQISILPSHLARLKHLVSLRVKNNPIEFPPPYLTQTSEILQFLSNCQEERKPLGVGLRNMSIRDLRLKTDNRPVSAGMPSRQKSLHRLNSKCIIPSSPPSKGIPTSKSTEDLSQVIMSEIEWRLQLLQAAQANQVTVAKILLKQLGSYIPNPDTVLVNLAMVSAQLVRFSFLDSAKSCLLPSEYRVRKAELNGIVEYLKSKLTRETCPVEVVQTNGSYDSASIYEMTSNLMSNSIVCKVIRSLEPLLNLSHNELAFYEILKSKLSNFVYISMLFSLATSREQIFNLKDHSMRLVKDTLLQIFPEEISICGSLVPFLLAGPDAWDFVNSNAGDCKCSVLVMAYFLQILSFKITTRYSQQIKCLTVEGCKNFALATAGKLLHQILQYGFPKDNLLIDDLIVLAPLGQLMRSLRTFNCQNERNKTLIVDHSSALKYAVSITSPLMLETSEPKKHGKSWHVKRIFRRTGICLSDNDCVLNFSNDKLPGTGQRPVLFGAATNARKYGYAAIYWEKDSEKIAFDDSDDLLMLEAVCRYMESESSMDTLFFSLA